MSQTDKPKNNLKLFLRARCLARNIIHYFKTNQVKLCTPALIAQWQHLANLKTAIVLYAVCHCV